jgi:hypothetical protein
VSQRIHELSAQYDSLLGELTNDEREEFSTMIDEALPVDVSKAAMLALVRSSERGASLVETFLALKVRFMAQTRN